MESVSVLPFIVQNPNLIGFILFVICFLPLLAYIMQQAGRQAERHQEFFNRAMDDAKSREERLGEIVNTTLADQTRALVNINTTMVTMNQNLCDVKERVNDIENIIGIKKEAS